MQEIFSEKIVTNRRTYFLDVKETREGSRYVVIGELTQVSGDVERHRVMIFEENLDAFMEGLEKVADFVLGSSGADDGEEALHPTKTSPVDSNSEESEEIKRLKRIEKKLDEVRRHFS